MSDDYCMKDAQLTDDYCLNVAQLIDIYYLNGAQLSNFLSYVRCITDDK